MRRTLVFLAACLLAAPAFGQIPTTTQDQNRINFLYAVNGYFGGSKFDSPKGVAVDEARNLVYVSDTGKNLIDAFSTQGIAKFQIGTNGELKSPTALAVDREGNLYVCEEGKSKVKVFNTDNEMCEVIDVGGICGAGAITRVKVARDGTLYFVDSDSQQVIVFDQYRKLKMKIGKPGADRGQFKNIDDVAFDRQGRIFVSDSTGTPVQVFDRKGKYIYRLGERGALDEDMVEPGPLVVDRYDQVWVTDTSQHDVKIFDRGGFYLRTFGEYGMGEGLLYYPIDLSVDSFGKVYVLERGLRRLQVFALEKPFQQFQRDQ